MDVHLPLPPKHPAHNYCFIYLYACVCGHECGVHMSVAHTELGGQRCRVSALLALCVSWGIELNSLDLAANVST